MRRATRKPGTRAPGTKGGGSRTAPGSARRTWYHPLLHTGRWTVYATITLFVLAAAFILVVHAWLPTFASRKDQIAEFISQRSSYRVQIERSEAYWHGLNPGLRIYGLTVYHPGGQQVPVQLKELRITLAWLPLLAGRIQINNLVLIHPDLSFERLASGSFRITGLAPVGNAIPGGGAGFLPWLFEQNDVAVKDGRAEWIDYMSGEPPLQLSHVNLSLRNSGNRHRLQVNADFPPAMCRKCSFLADVTGNPLSESRWHGNIDVQAEGLDTYALPKIIRSKLPAGIDGRFNVNVASRWKNDVPVSLQGYAAVRAFKLAFPGLPAFDVKTAAAQVNWTATSAGGSWTLQLSRLQLGLVSAPWIAGQMRVEHNPYADHLYVQHVNLDDIDAFLATLKGNGKLPLFLRRIQPRGVVDNLRLRLDTRGGNISGYALDADMHNVAFDPYGVLPGISGLTGHLAVGQDGGELVLASKASEVSMPRVFRHAIRLRGASGRISWQHDDGAWHVHGKDLNAAGNDGVLQGTLRLDLPDASDASPRIDLEATLSDGNLADAGRYYPDIMPVRLRHWLNRAVVSGTVVSGQVTLRGALQDFPFRDGQGQFQVLAHIRQGTFRYLKGWPDITNIDADLLASGPGLSVTSRSGSIDGLALHRVAVTIDDLAAHDGPPVHAVGQITGPVDQMLGVLYASHIRPRPQFLFPGLHASGQGALSLDMVIPADAPSQMRMKGTCQFLDAALYPPVPGLGITSLSGTLQFDRDGLDGGGVRGRLLGGDASLEVATESAAPGHAAPVIMRASGTMTDAGLQQALGAAFGSRLSGDIPWHATVHTAGQKSQLSLALDLQQLGLDLPPPFKRTAGTAGTLILKTYSSDPRRQVLELNADGMLSGRFVLHRDAAGRWSFARGAINAGSGPAAPAQGPGLQVGVETPVFDVDRWWRIIQGLGGDRLDSGFGSVLAGVRLTTGQLYFMGRNFGAFRLAAAKTGQGWQGTLSGNDVLGSIDVRRIPFPTGPALVSVPAEESMLGPPARGRQGAAGQGGLPGIPLRDHIVNLDLQRLTVPPGALGPAASAVGPEHEVDPRALPEIHLHVGHFEDWGKPLGDLTLDAVPSVHGLHFQSLRLVQPDVDVSANGDWKISQTGAPMTDISMQVHSTNLGAVLAGLGYAGELAHGDFNASGQWQWSGAPTAFTPALLNGNCVLSVKNGRLPRVSPGGAGRLLGLIDTRALTRYLALDFSNVFGKGFTFDSIGGRISVKNGSAYTDGLTVKGPSATIDLRGRLGLATRDMDLKIKVVPRLGDQLTVTSMLLGGPVVGAAVAVFRNILKKPLEQTTETQYTVTGSWDNPKVVKQGLFVNP